MNFQWRKDSGYLFFLSILSVTAIFWGGGGGGGTLFVASAILMSSDKGMADSENQVTSKANKQFVTAVQCPERSGDPCRIRTRGYSTVSQVDD